MKAFDDNGIAFDCFEALPDVGGIWNPESPHAVYGSTHLNSSEKLTRYIDLWFPEGLPYYLSCSQAEDYLRSYAREFGLYDKISFNKKVSCAKRVNGRWEIEIEGEKKPRVYDGLVVANGHHWHAKMPTDPGKFDGEIMHSHDVKSKEQIKGKRVLVVGAAIRRSIFCPTRRSMGSVRCTRCGALIISSRRRFGASRPISSSTV